METGKESISFGEIHDLDESGRATKFFTAHVPGIHLYCALHRWRSRRLALGTSIDRRSDASLANHDNLSRDFWPDT